MYSSPANVYSGFFGRGDMQKEFEVAAFDLDKGGLSGVVDTASGLHLIQR
jgi:NIMA-interacting peptidyl-prolyl cis-trans isomerase 1